jgi:hypothetical protein
MFNKYKNQNWICHAWSQWALSKQKYTDFDKIMNKIFFE